MKWDEKKKFLTLGGIRNAFSSGVLPGANYIVNGGELLCEKARLSSAPCFLGIEPTRKCNSQCRMCTKPLYYSKGWVEEGDMSWETFERTKPLWKWAIRVLLGGFGEPLLHPRYIDMATELKKRRRFVHSFTNGILLEENMSKELVEMGFDLIHISLGGATPETYKYTRGVDALDRVAKNLEMIQRIKQRRKAKKPEVRFNIVAMNSVVRQLPEIIKLAADLGVSGLDMFHLRVYFEEIEPESVWNNKEESLAKFQEAQMLGKKHGVQVHVPSFESRKRQCMYPLNQFLVAWDGQAVSCPSGHFSFGNINEQSLRKVWNSFLWQEFRRRLWQEGYQNLCSHCSEWCPNDREQLHRSIPDKVLERHRKECSDGNG